MVDTQLDLVVAAPPTPCCGGIGSQGASTEDIMLGAVMFGSPPLSSR